MAAGDTKRYDAGALEVRGALPAPEDIARWTCGLAGGDLDTYQQGDREKLMKVSRKFLLAASDVIARAMHSNAINKATKGKG